MHTANISPPETGELRLERLPRVLARTGLSRSSFYELISKGTFPTPVRIGARAIAFDARAVDAWINGRIADAKAAP